MLAAMCATTVLPRQRHRFALPRDLAFFNHAYIAPHADVVHAAARAAVDRAQRPWEIAPADFFDPAERVRERFVALIGGDADGVAHFPSVAYGMTQVARTLALPRGSSVVVLAEQFPSHVYPWREAAARAGARIVTVPRRRDDDWTAGVLAALDEGTAVVAVPPQHWTDGTVVDLEAVGRACREAGAALVVDGSQSLGAAPFDVTRVHPDAVVAAAYKWLLGPTGCALGWFAPHRRDGEPVEPGWMNRAGSEDFAGLVDYTDAYRPGARRYDVGGAGQQVHMATAGAALGLLLEWGVPAITATIAQITATIADAAADLGLAVPPAERRSGHVLGVRLPAAAAARVPGALAADRVHASVRGTTLRIAPHIYCDEIDVERLLGALRRALR